MSTQLLDTPAKYSFSLSGLADRTWGAVTEATFRAGWSPAIKLAESFAVSILQKIKIGTLNVQTSSHNYTFGGTGELRGELRVLNDVFWVRLCTMGDLGFSEAYMFGDVECDDLMPVFKKFTAWRFLNTITNSISNISAHYDISNDMFAGFLSPDMTYSCAIFTDLDADLKKGANVRKLSLKNGTDNNKEFLPWTSTFDHAPFSLPSGEDDLYDGQVRKLQHIIRRARIRPGHRVLEIGSGWGSMAILIAQTLEGTTIDTITLSVQQRELAVARIAQAGLQDRIRVHLMDYRCMPPEWEGAFDRLVSVEMVEAVGAEFLLKYWGVIDWALKREGGVGVIQSSTIPEGRYEKYLKDIDFIRKWASKGRLVPESVSNIGPHFARTLREWRRRFLDTFEDVVVPSLRKEYPDVMDGKGGRYQAEVFKRKWLYYFYYCEVGFATRLLGDHIITFTREGCTEYGCDVYE
ncbi:hypothetical protein ONZ45_g10624 [Pleurotus djamor]|nr:hypothetical protein ONZ45_g10624 [Pleurotus djamor]